MKTIQNIFTNRIFTIFFILTLAALTVSAATLTVTKAADTKDGACDSDCSLREAIVAAAPGDEIVFASPLFDSAQTITLTNAAGFNTLVINKSLKITGKGANLLTIKRGTSDNSLNGAFRIFNVTGSGIQVTLSGMIITGGHSYLYDGGGINNNSGSTLTVIGCNITGNNGYGLGGGIYNAADSTLTVIGSTVSSNSAGSSTYTTDSPNGRGGGGIDNRGSLTVVNSTVSGNYKGNSQQYSDYNGGGIYTSGATLISSSTITNNRAEGGSSAGGVYNDGANVTIRNSIAAAATSPTIDVAGSAFTSQGYNLIGNIGGATGFGATGDQIGSASFAGDSPSATINPMLDTLGMYGGTTPTHRLQSNSPAIDKGNSFGTTTDQRGEIRPIDDPSVTNGAGDAADIGAFEVQPPPNQSPVANSDSYSTNRNTTLTVNASGVLANDTDADNNSLTAIKVSDPAHGSLSLNADGSFTYTPNTGYVGADSFTYKANDGTADSNIATVNLTVNPGAAQFFTVTKTADTNDGTCDSDCSLREAIAAAANGDTIQFASPLFDSPQTITLSDAGGFQSLVINKNLTVAGKGANLLTILRSTSLSAFRIFEIGSGSNVNLSGMTVSGGSADSGGGIYNSGTLNLSASVVSGNVASGFGGGGIYSDVGSTLTVTGSTISGNFTGNGNGGGVVAIGTISLVNTTISNNSAFLGGAIITFQNSSTTLSLTGCTVSNNSATSSGGGIFDQSGSATLRNTIVADNTAASNNPDLGGTFVSQGFNLVGNTSGATITPTTGDQFGTAAAPIDPRLGSLQNNGGATPTRALLAGSPAIDKGKSFGLTTDQRGLIRPVDLSDATYPNAAGGDGADIGAFEAQTTPAGETVSSFVVSKIADTNDGVCDADCSLREAITAANDNAGADVITFNIAGASPQTIQLTSTLPDLAQSVKIQNDSGKSVIVRGEGAANPYRIFNVNAGQIVEISRLTMTNGNSNDAGGGINNNGTLALFDSTVSNNISYGFGGGGIYNASTLNITRSTISGNIADGNGNGGGIAGVGTINIANSTISDNSAVFGGGIITFPNTALTISGSTISNNSSQNFGGGILEQAGGAIIHNTIVANNTAVTNQPDVSGTFNSEGYNLIEDTSGATINETQNAGTNITGQDPMLGPLQNNGGATETRALSTGSPAIDKGNSFGTTTDQRGINRPSDSSTIANAAGGDGADIGAFEVLFSPTATAVTISGRVLSGDGRGLSNARIMLTDAGGNTRMSVTSAFGYYRFNDVRSSETYIIQVSSKRFQFTPQVVFVSDDINDLNFAATGNSSPPANRQTIFEGKN